MLQKMENKKESSVNDFHIHFGQFREYFFEAEDIKELVDSIGIDKFGIMPTSTTGTQDYEWEIAETQKIMQLMPNQAIPYLRVYPEMLEKSNDLTLFDSLPFRLIKIHGYAHDWHTDTKRLERVFEIANDRKLPMLFHTGGRDESSAGKYLNLSKKFKDVKVVLAHGRPVDEAILVLQQCENVYVDTAFMPLEDISSIVGAGLGTKIVFGTDFPVNIAFYDEKPDIWHLNHVDKLIKLFGNEMMKVWSNDNFNKILNL